jgi:hypothetical protein
MSTNNPVAALAATARVKAEIDRNHVGVAPEGEMAEHRDPNKVNKAAAIDAFRVAETTED